MRFAREQAIDLTVVGPELPLTLGLVDRFARRRAARVRPDGRRGAARGLEGVHQGAAAHACACRRPSFGAFDRPRRRRDAYVDEVGAPVRREGRRARGGQGRLHLPDGRRGARTPSTQVMRRARCSATPAARVVIEEFLEGEELSFMALTDGDDRAAARGVAGSQARRRRRPRSEHRRHGRVLAAPVADAGARRSTSCATSWSPSSRGLARQGIRYTGVLYAGLMVHDGRAKVLEFNVRFGDPEAQVLLAAAARPTLPT